VVFEVVLVFGSCGGKLGDLKIVEEKLFSKNAVANDGVPNDTCLQCSDSAGDGHYLLNPGLVNRAAGKVDPRPVQVGCIDPYQQMNWLTNRRTSSSLPFFYFNNQTF
jgi:hypothetical protein